MAKMNPENRNRYAVITGATSGIGFELAKLFAKDSYNLILVARSEERLQQVTNQLKQFYSIEVTPIAKDLFKPDAAKALYDQVKGMNITVDVLVNDAGQGQWGPFIETPLEREIDIIQLNITSLVTLTKLFLQDMVARNEGRILQLGSEAGTAPMPLFSVYSATKAFVLSFSAALSEEMKDKNITITVLLPGATDTDFFHKAEQEETVVYKEKGLAAPEDVAKDGYEALMRGENKIISGAKTKMHVMMNDFMGSSMSAAMNRKQMEPSNKEGRERPTHEPSVQEREYIESQTGKNSGDLEKE